VFKEDGIPFNRTTYKIFGDKDHLTAVLSNRPKFMRYLNQKGVNLKLKTEREFLTIITNYISSDLVKKLAWDL